MLQVQIDVNLTPTIMKTKQIIQHYHVYRRRMLIFDGAPKINPVITECNNDTERMKQIDLYIKTIKQGCLEDYKKDITRFAYYGII